MRNIKIHTHYPEDTEKILNTLNFDYSIIENYFRLLDLSENENHFNLPEFKWGDHLNNRTVYNVVIHKIITDTDKLSKEEILENEKNKKENDDFFTAFNKNVNTKSSYIRYKMNECPYGNYEYSFTKTYKTKYPIFILSKGRWEQRYTADTLEKMNVDYRIVIEPQEVDNYAKYIDRTKILVLPDEYLNKNQGGIPARNFIWDYSVKKGFKKHWIIDDNIDGFYRWNNNVQKRVDNGVFFRIMEDFSDRYSNLGLTSCQYHSFVPAIDTGRHSFIVNTRTYSCILINTELLDKRLEERWRGRYNEDTDLTLRVLSTGDICTVNFNSLLSGKKTSGSMKGGNTNTIYDGGSHKGYQDKLDELYNNWSQYVKKTTKRHKDGRPHHHISYTKYFKQELVLKEGIETEPIINNYGMEFKYTEKTKEKKKTKIINNKDINEYNFKFENKKYKCLKCNKASYSTFFKKNGELRIHIQKHIKKCH
jgi:hypothetical protein